MIENYKYFISSANRNNSLIVPIFMPFWACPQICVFCNQALQTGQASCDSKLITAKSSLENIKILLVDAHASIIEARNKTHKNIEIAFYGGTFSALPNDEFYYALDFLKKMKESGLITSARCSTRPDACDKARLVEMKEAGIDTIELGIQSFSNKALSMSNRGYKEDIAIQACKIVKDFGFNLGIQLMPNMPAQTKEDFIYDIEKVLEIKASFIRLYPCLVVENTPLEKIWKNKAHKVWEFDETINLLSIALYKMWLANISVIRIGVASEPEFYKKVLAGVRHEALGQLVQALAFKRLIKTIIEENNLENKDIEWNFPLQSKGYIHLKKDSFWKEHGIDTHSIKWHEDERVLYKLK